MLTFCDVDGFVYASDIGLFSLNLRSIIPQYYSSDPTPEIIFRLFDINNEIYDRPITLLLLKRFS